MKGINGTRTKKVKVEENEFFTGADTEAGIPCAGAEWIESSQVNVVRRETAQTDVARRESARTDAVRSGAAQTDVAQRGTLY